MTLWRIGDSLHGLSVAYALVVGEGLPAVGGLGNARAADVGALSGTVIKIAVDASRGHLRVGHSQIGQEHGLVGCSRRGDRRISPQNSPSLRRGNFATVGPIGASIIGVRPSHERSAGCDDPVILGEGDELLNVSLIVIGNHDAVVGSSNPGRGRGCLGLSAGSRLLILAGNGGGVGTSGQE